MKGLIFKMNKKDNMDDHYKKNSKEMQKNRKEEKNKKQEKSKESPDFDIEVGEDATQYGEFISSYFAWIPLPKQKERAEELNNMTKDKKDKNK